MPRQIHSRVVLKKPKVVFKDLSSEGVVGLTYDYQINGEHKAEIEKVQTDRELFLTTVHEIISHLLLPDLTEKQAIKLEKLYGVALWNVVLRLKRKWLKSLDKS